MRTALAILSIGLLLIGLAALIIVPRAWAPEPLLVFKIGVGVGIFAGCALIVLLLQAYLIGDWFQQRRADRELRDARRAYDEAHRQFIHRLDHEMKNPLTGLQAELVNLREASGAMERQKSEANIQGTVERLGALLHDLRKLTDLEETQLERTVVDIPLLITEMVDAACSLPAYKGREINIMVSKVPWPLPKVTGDPDLLGLAFYNLIDNALKFTSPGDAVEIRVREDARSVIVEVADSGPGIPPAEQSLVFDDLYRGENARGIEGSGLGLSIVQRIITLHVGDIFLRSQQEEAYGTVFTIRLPVTSESKS